MKILFSRLIEYFQHLLSAGSSNYVTFARFCEFEVCISYSPPDKISASYIKLVLKSFNVEAVMIERRDSHRHKSKVYSYNTCVSIVPPKYGQISSEDYEFKKDLRCLIKYQKSNLVLISTDKTQYSSIRVLLSSIDEVSPYPIQVIYLDDFHQGLSIPINQMVNVIMAKKEIFKSNDLVENIMTGKKHLLTVSKYSSVSDVYLLMEESGKRHCPVIDEDKKFVRMISRGDMYEKIPPMPDKMPPAVLENIELDPNVAHQALMNLVSQNVGEVFPSPVGNQDIVALKDTSTISDAIKEFITPHTILTSQGVKKITYFTALPVLNSKGEIEGIVSFVDIFKKFFKYQTKFMDTPLSHLATMAEYYQEPEEHDKKIKIRKGVLTKLGAKSTFSNAKMIMDIRGFRSLPVVAEKPITDEQGKPIIDEEGKPTINDQELIGFVNDVQIKMFSHKDFFSGLFPLPVSHFMTKADLLHKPKPDDVIDQLIDMFSLPDGNQQIPSSFAICDSDEKNRLLGIVSYLDILKYWKDIAIRRDI